MTLPRTAIARPTLPPRVLVAIIVTVIVWASAFVVIRWVSPHFSGGALALGRLIVGSLALGLVLIGRRWVAPTRRQWLLITGFGVCWFGGYNVALNIGEQTLEAGTAAMVVNIAPILIAAAAAFFLKERIAKWLIIGGGIAFLGVVLIGVSTGATGVGNGVGILWCLLAAFTFAAGVLFQKPVLGGLPSQQVTWLGCVIGGIFCLPFIGDLIHEVQAAPVSSIAGMVYLGIFPTALAYSTWAYALTRMPAGQLGVTTYVVPAMVIVMAFLAFSEIPTVLAIVGGAICLVGVAVSRRRDATPRGHASRQNLAE
ncbi:DMT family transporter [Parafrigoribacterium mesophilum]|uniref:DMT family transporter n=1 Tax=Parafrigoribacterium mesophilum TaxID=433646 RepID=UPI0031FE4141